MRPEGNDRVVVRSQSGRSEDSLYEAVIYVRGQLHGLGADAQEEPMTEADVAVVADLLRQAGMDFNPAEFKRIGSARKLYHWNSEHQQAY